MKLRCTAVDFNLKCDKDNGTTCQGGHQYYKDKDGNYQETAVKSDKEGWRAEAAIPLADLTGERITVGKAWACNVVRVLPGRGVQGWSLPADVEPRPEGMGLLLFRSLTQSR